MSDADKSPDDALSECLGALASPTRIAILRGIRTPKALREIEVHVPANGPPIARQTVRKHLDVLIETGVVTTREAERDYGDTQEFIVNHQRVFSISEELRALAKIAPTVELSLVTTPASGQRAAVAARPSLVTVKGLDEGRSFDLDPAGGTREWVIGRRRGLAVSLDFDPSTSSENAVIRWDGKDHVLEDVAGSRNGTSVNFDRLAPGEKRPLEHGDIIGVGRCLLVYRRPRAR